jgi:hypothetical protein
MRMKYIFYVATFVLRRVSVNQHNSRQCYILNEIINQSELTRGLVSHTRI